MSSRNLLLNLGDGDEELSIVIRGKPCRVEDLQMLLFAYAKELAKKQPNPTPAQPCGCKDKK